MSEETTDIVEEVPAIAPGLALAMAEVEDTSPRRRRGPQRRDGCGRVRRIPDRAVGPRRARGE